MELLVNPPCLIFEDEDLLVANKPAGMNTHAPAPYAGEGFYDWLRHREPRWSSLALVHRLDKDTSGLIVFPRTPEASRGLTEQFSAGSVQKTYLLLTDQSARQSEIKIESSIVRAGDRYVSRPVHRGAARAVTRFRALNPGRTLLEAEPLTGKTHQIRVHASAAGFPILGDRLYGGAPASRMCLHAARIRFVHPTTRRTLSFEAAANFTSDPGFELRSALIDPSQTNAFRLVHGDSDGHPGWHVDQLGDFLLCQHDDKTLDTDAGMKIENWKRGNNLQGAYVRASDLSRADNRESAPRFVSGKPAPDPFIAIENGVRFELSLAQGGACGLFLDQRDNRRRVLTRHVAAEFPLLSDAASNPSVLNTFAYTCGFSVCAALAGLRTTSLDLSKHYLDWGRRNFALNGLRPADHEFIHGEVFDWLRRLHRKERQFDLVILDPPTFSQSKEHGVFRAEKDYRNLVKCAAPLVTPRGALFASTNASRYEPADFLDAVRKGVTDAGRRVEREHYAPQPPDFPISRREPAHLKTVWMRLG